MEILLVYNQVPEQLQMYRIKDLVPEDMERLKSLNGKAVNSSEHDVPYEDYEFFERVIKEFGELVYDDQGDNVLPLVSGTFDVVVFTFLL